jgi:hypothetical protein
MKLQLFSLSSIFQELCPSPIFPFHFHFHFHFRESYSIGINPPMIFLSVSKITVDVIGWPSQRL